MSRKSGVPMSIPVRLGANERTFNTRGPRPTHPKEHTSQSLNPDSTPSSAVQGPIVANHGLVATQVSGLETPTAQQVAAPGSATPRTAASEATAPDEAESESAGPMIDVDEV
jgi:hypothetical protein